MLGRHHEDALLHYGHALAQAQALDPFDQARERLQARAARRGCTVCHGRPGGCVYCSEGATHDPTAAETLGAQAAARPGGAADRAVPDDCPCARCAARRTAEAAKRVAELACRIQARVDQLSPSPPPPPAPHDTDPDARARHRHRG